MDDAVAERLEARSDTVLVLGPVDLWGLLVGEDRRLQPAVDEHRQTDERSAADGVVGEHGDTLEDVGQGVVDHGESWPV